MFFSVNGADFRKKHPELEPFVLDKRRRYVPPKYRYFVYFSRGDATDIFRYPGESVPANYHTGEMWRFSEISFPPFGYVMTVNSNCGD